ncbi:hypothetical protein SK128_013358 [Halocaridina rubra]|uniref:Uncharacterized protein n=1 Tax=Halocaridina rubra TaxID=373956 RepID=A0AAN8X3A4_HALRR
MNFKKFIKRVFFAINVDDMGFIYLCFHAQTVAKVKMSKNKMSKVKVSKVKVSKVKVSKGDSKPVKVNASHKPGSEVGPDVRKGICSKTFGAKPTDIFQDATRKKQRFHMT